MTLLRTLALAAACTLLAAPLALAQEAITTAPAGAPPAAEGAPAPVTPMRAEDSNSPQAIGRWAQDVLAGKPAEPEQIAAGGPDARRGCSEPADRKPHGEVWGGIGSGGYRNVGAVVTQPIGKCGSITVGAEKTEFDAPRRRR